MTRYLLTQLVGRAMRLSGTSYRFGKEYRWGVSRWHRAVYSMFCTFGANIIADGERFPFIR